MEDKAVYALRWIVEILKNHSIRYRIGGGLAAHMYGSNRQVQDIDIVIPEADLKNIVPVIKPYITYGPTRYKDSKWDCELVTITYHGQEIDICGGDSLRMSTKDELHWLSLNEPRFWDTVRFSVNGLDIEVMNPRALLEYKKERDPNTIDTDAIQKYISEHHLN